MSEIVTTANTDAPANYYQSRHSGEEIDNAVDMMGGGTSPANGLASLGAKSRLNLLKNPYFTENSRGQEEYTAAGETVDNWEQDGGLTCTVTANGVKIACTKTTGRSFRQYIQVPADYIGEKVTFSVLAINVNGAFRLIAGDENGPIAGDDTDIQDTGLHFITITVPAGVTRLYLQANPTTVGHFVQLRAAKIELGDKSTLAYPEVVKAPNLAESLLENGDFSLNSLGKAEYVGVADTVDNWFSTNSNLTVQVAEDGVHLTCKDSGNGYFRQLIGKLPVGTYTISALVKGTGTLYLNLCSKDYSSSFSGLTAYQLLDDWGIAQYTYQITNNLGWDAECAYLRANPGSTINVQAIKLEKGNASTLEPLVDKTIWTLVDQPDRPVEALRSACYYDGEWQGLIRGIGAKPGDNILINPLFKINQRGDSSYSGKIGGTVDAWKTSNTNTTVKVTARGVTISASSGSTPYLVQVLDDDKSTALLGKTVSLSVLNQDGHLHSISQVLPEKVTNVNQVCCYIPGQCDLLVMSTGAIWVRLMASAGGTNSFSAAKLELGPTQTLARQMENGTWEVLEQPDPLELLKCQRYLVVYDTYGQRFVGVGNTETMTKILGVIYLPVPMRIIPTITGDLSVFGGKNNLSASNVSISGVGSTGLLVSLTVSGMQGSEQLVSLYTPTQLILSAEL